jgi:hypothetical protein
MPRDFRINGETLVKVKGGAHLSGHVVGNLTELGLAVDQITVVPKFRHQELKVNDFGPDVPAEVLTMLAEVMIRMNLVHYDHSALDVCIAEAMGGTGDFFTEAGTLAPAGTPLGAGIALHASGNHYISVNLLSPVLDRPWRFRACYLADQPIEYPLGTKASVVSLTWRCIPYTTFTSVVSLSTSGQPTVGGEILSSGVVLWDRTLDS